MEDFFALRRRRNKRCDTYVMFSELEDDPPEDIDKPPPSCDNESTNCVTTADSKGFTAIQSDSELSGTDGSNLSTRSSDFTYDERVERYQLRKKERVRRRSTANLGVKPVGGCFQTAALPEMLKRQGLHIDNLVYIGGGTFARVYRGSLCGASGPPGSPGTVAVKCIRSRHLYNPARKPKWLEREAQMAQIKKHPNIVQILDVSIDQEPCVLVMEYCAGGSIYDLLFNRSAAAGAKAPEAAPQKPALRVINWCQRMKVAMDVAAGMAHLHSMGILHRDLKTANVMLVQQLTGPAVEPHAKIGDFGLARFLEENDRNKYLTSDVGSSIYMAPEVFTCMAEQSKAPYTNKMDVYSYSMMLYELLTDCLPYQGREELKSRNPQGVGHLVGREHVRPDAEQIPGDAPGVLQDVMRRAWVFKPVERPAFREIIQELDPAYMSMVYRSRLSHLSRSNPFASG